MQVRGQILTAAQMRDAEQILIDAGETVESLMERAGRGAADYVFRMAAGRPVTVLCGPGNNGGDGYVIARVLAERSVPVQVVAPLEPTTAAARAARAAWGKEPVNHAYGHVFVDCLFGTGLARHLADDLRELLIDLVYSHDRWVAIDLPSGVDADTGAFLIDKPPEYDLTIALGAWKRAHWLMPSSAMMGARQVVDIGIGKVDGAAILAEPRRLSAPDPAAHKYTRGLVAVVSGAVPGAAILAAGAAMHGGAGYIKLLAEGGTANVPADLVVDALPLRQCLKDNRIAALLIGPGLGRDQHSLSQLSTALAFAGPLVVDGDALTMLTQDMLADRIDDTILTPHAGEMERLCASFAIGGGDRLARIEALAVATRATVIAKGPDTVIAPGPRAQVSKRHPPLTIMPNAPSWLSIAGTGDVLAGLAASRLAKGETPFEASVTACQLHSEAARLAGPAFSASDLVRHIPAAYANFL